MKFWEIFRFEFVYQVSRIWTWLIFAVLIVVNFLMTRDNSLAEALYEDFFVNSPFAIAKTMVFGSLIWLVSAPIIAGAAAARDVEMRMDPLVYTSPISKAQYLGGRFLAALVVNALILLAVPAGIVLATYLADLDTTLLAPFSPAAYLTSYAYIALANAFVATAIQFSIAATSGRPMASYLGSVLLVFMGFFIASLLLFKRGLGTMLDPIGIRFFVEDASHLWTTVEKNTRLLELEGVLLRNRLLWFGIGVVFLAYTYFQFQFRHQVAKNSRFQMPTRWISKLLFKKPEINTSSGSDREVRTHQGEISTFRSGDQRRFGFAMHARQTLVIAWNSFKATASSWAGLALLIPIPLMTVLVVLDQMEHAGGVLIPTTINVISELTAPLSAELSRWVIIPGFIIFFAGELVWREREARLAEITDAIPGSEWARLVGKFLGLALVLTVFMAALTTSGILAQLIMDYHPDSYGNEIGLYMKIMFGLQLPEYLLFAILALMVHVVVNQKYIAHLVTVIVYVFIVLPSLFGIEHSLLVYGAGPLWSYSDMRGFGPSLGPWFWFKLYWTAWALLLALAAKVLWARGTERGLRIRLQIARHRFNRATVWTASVAVGLIMVLGGFIFYNTNMLNTYLTASEIKERQAEYEKRYRRYIDKPQPRLTKTSLQIEIFPNEKTVDISGIYHLVNRSTVAIDSILIGISFAVESGNITFDPPASHLLTDDVFGHRLYRLRSAIQPGDSLRMKFNVHSEPKGFGEGGADASVVANGTYITDKWLPSIGYQANRELISASDRREYGLPTRPLIASLYDKDAPNRRSEGITFEAVIGTDEDQVAIAPGALRKSWTTNSRRYFHYSTDAPIGSEWTFLSADYTVHEAQWQNPDSPEQKVTIRVFHQPGRSAHMERMLQSIQGSLNYYTKEFGPYPYNHITVAERPGNGTGLHADASMLTHGEGFPLWIPRDAPGSLDFPFAIIAHEMAHQWTVPYANVEGAPVMSESIAWYYGLKMVEQTKGHDELTRLLEMMRQPNPYPPIRRGEPLLRALDPYMSYRKGPFALYTLSQYVGEAKVNRALRFLLAKHRPLNAPLATTLDLYRELEAVTPDSLQYLLNDLFKVNTYWELETKQVSATQTGKDSWQATLEVEAHKMVYDSAGTETEVEMNDWIEIGIYPLATNGKEAVNPFYLRKHRIISGRQKVIIDVAQQPDHAGIDPRHLLIDLDMNNNTRNLKTSENVQVVEDE